MKWMIATNNELFLKKKLIPDRSQILTWNAALVNSYTVLLAQDTISVHYPL